MRVYLNWKSLFTFVSKDVSSSLTTCDCINKIFIIIYLYFKNKKANQN